VRELVGKEFCVVVDGLTFPVESRGFFQTGVKPVKRLRTAQGFELRLTADHRVQRVRKRSRYVLNAEWCEAGHLRPGDEIVVSNQRRAPAWSGAGTREQGWLLGMLVGDGTFRAEPREMACLDLWGEERGALAARAEAALRAPGMGIGRLWRTEDRRHDPPRVRRADAARARLRRAPRREDASPTRSSGRHSSSTGASSRACSTRTVR
jgi:ribonucleoside-diphosphate reductase alpha chain